MTTDYLTEIQAIKWNELNGNGFKRSGAGSRKSEGRRRKPIGDLALLKAFFLSTAIGQ
jgi:hypothetical protein